MRQSPMTWALVFKSPGKNTETMLYLSSNKNNIYSKKGRSSNNCNSFVQLLSLFAFLTCICWITLFTLFSSFKLFFCAFFDGCNYLLQTWSVSWVWAWMAQKKAAGSGNWWELEGGIRWQKILWGMQILALAQSLFVKKILNQNLPSEYQNCHLLHHHQPPAKGEISTHLERVVFLLLRLWKRSSACKFSGIEVDGGDTPNLQREK